MVTEVQLVAFVESFEHKVARLADHAERLSERIKDLEDENKRLARVNREQDKLIKQLQKKQPSAQPHFPNSKDFGKIVVNNLADTAASAEFKKRLDEYIREIERCIEHLSNMS